MDVKSFIASFTARTEVALKSKARHLSAFSCLTSSRIKKFYGGAWNSLVVLLVRHISLRVFGRIEYRPKSKRLFGKHCD